MKTQQFDAVAMKRRGAEAILVATAYMTLEEQLAYWHERTEALQQRQQAARRAMESVGEQDGRSAV